MVIMQYVSTFDQSDDSVRTLTNDPCLSEFIQFLNAVLYNTAIPKPSDGPIPDVVLEILKFMNTLVVRNTFLLDTIAASSNLDLLIPQFFDANVMNGAVIESEPSNFFLPLKFLALLASSKHVRLNSSSAANTLIIVLASLLNNPQLSAWAAACVAGLCRHCEAFNTILKGHSMVSSIKASLTSLLPSCDPCVVVAALAATVMLFNIGDNTDTAVTAALKYLLEDSQFPLSTQLCAWTIVSLAKRVRLPETDLCTILELPLHVTGTRACAAYWMLSQLVDMKYRFGTKDQLKELMRSLLHCDNDYVAVAGCHFLLSLSANAPSLFTHLDDDGALICDAVKSLNNLARQNDTERTEAILIEIRLLIQSSGINSTVIEALTSEEDLFFTNFLRHIEANHAFLSVAFFSVLMMCSTHIPRWSMRVKRLLVDSQFPALLAHVLTSSHNRTAISDALRALQFYINDCEAVPDKNSFFFDSAVAGFLVVNKCQQGAPESIPGISQNRGNEASAKSLENENQRLLRENAKLQVSLASESKRAAIITENNVRAAEDIRKRDHEIIRLQQEVSKLSIDLGDKEDRLQVAQTAIDERRQENTRLMKLVEHLQCKQTKRRLLKKVNCELENQIRDFESNVDNLKLRQRELRHLAKALKRELRQRENQLVEVQRTCDETQQRNLSLQSSIASLSEQIEALTSEKTALISSLNDSTAENSKLAQTITTLESEALTLRSQIRTSSEIKAQNRAKTASLHAKIHELEDEKSHWEGIARFIHEVGDAKSSVVSTFCKQIP